jgi:hypothetical protein
VHNYPPGKIRKDMQIHVQHGRGSAHPDKALFVG